MLSSILNKNTNQVTARWVVLLIDVSIVLQTFFVAYIVRFNFTLNFGTYQFIQQLPLVAVVALFSFYLIGSYKGVVRHTGTRDAYNVFIASILLAFFLVLIVFINHQFNILETFTIPLSIITIHFMLNVIFMIASRYVFKHVYNTVFKGINYTKKILIYGAGDSGMITYNTVKNDSKSGLKVFGFIEDDEKKVGKKYDRVHVFHSDKITEDFISDNKIKEIIVSIQNIASSDLLNIVDKLTRLPVKVKIVPPVEKWIDGTLKASQIKEIKIEDLLNRNPIELDNPNIKEELEGKTVLITGAAGSIGSEIANQVRHYKYKQLLLLDQAESPLYTIQQSFIQKGTDNFQCIIADVRDRNRMETLFKENNIQIVFHAAAYKHVPLMEEFPYEAVQVNILGSKTLMDLSLENGIEKFVMISTDKAVNPTNVMGASKRVAEIYARYCASFRKTQFITTRFGNVLGSNGSVIPLFKKQIAEGGPLTLTHKDITRFFMTIPEACQLVLEAGAMGKGGEIYVFDMGQSVKIFDLAKRMIHLSGFKYPSEIDINIIGLRPGEKLYEELLSDEENTTKTHHPKIMIAKVSKTSTDLLHSCIDKLDNEALSEKEIVKELKKMIPEFISNNSIYSELDK